MSKYKGFTDGTKLEKTKAFGITKDYSKANQMLYSEDWNEFYTGMLMKSELSLEDSNLEVGIFSNNESPKIKVIVSREAQIQMHIWYSIIKRKTFLKENIPYKNQNLLIEKARNNWSRIVKITQNLKSTENLIDKDKLDCKILDEYGKTRKGLNAWKIKQDNSNRFVYLPIGGIGREIKILDCMFHYRDEKKRNLDEVSRQDRSLQGNLWFVYMELTNDLPKSTESPNFISIIKENYLFELFEGNLKLVNLV
jgi:hypothetical protein